MDAGFWLSSGVLAALTAASVAVSSYFVWRATGRGPVWRPDMLRVSFGLHLLLQSAVCALLVGLGHTKHYLLVNVSPSSLAMGVLVINWAMIGFGLGAWAARGAFSRVFPSAFARSSRALSYPEIQPASPQASEREFLVLAGFGVLCLASLVYSLAHTERIALFELLRGASREDVLRARIESRFSFGGIAYVRNIFTFLLLPFVSCVAFAYLRVRSGSRWVALNVVLFVASVLALAYDTQKAPVLAYVASLGLARVLQGPPVRVWKALLAGAAFMALIVGVYAAVVQSDPASSLFVPTQGLPGRVFYTQAAGVFLSLDVFPEKHPFIGWSSLSGFLSSLLGQESMERSARVLMRLVNPTAVEQGTAGVINSLFVAEAYANFGWKGVALAPLWVGFLTGSLLYVLLAQTLTPIVVAFFAFAALRWPLTGGFNDFLYSPTFAILLVVTLVLPYGLRGRR